MDRPLARAFQHACHSGPLQARLSADGTFKCSLPVLLLLIHALTLLAVLSPKHTWNSNEEHEADGALWMSVCSEMPL